MTKSIFNDKRRVIQNEINNLNYLKRQDLKNPYRLKELIKESIKSNNLDLNGLVVFTEAASKNFVATPIIATMAGAKVFAITKDSTYGKGKDIATLTYRLADFCDIKDNIKVIFSKKKEIIYQANIVTNIGFVRPIDKRFINMMNKKAVIPYMYEAWEFRKDDIDLNACKLNTICVMATNEDTIGLKVFDYVGPLSIKMLFELEIEVYKNKIVILSKDKFGKIIKKYLTSLGAQAIIIDSIKSKRSKNALNNCDALIIANYNDNKIKNELTKSKDLGKKLIQLSRKISIVQLTGEVNIEEFDKNNIPYFPKRKLDKYRMGMTFADLGPKPLIELHAAGLKVGEVMAKARLNGKSINETIKIALKNSPAQLL